MELRNKTIGILKEGGKYYSVSMISTIRNNKIRIISLRKARKEERKIYLENIN